MRYRFIFVCQGGELELKACLLAASLVQNLKLDHELVAAIPSSHYAEPPTPETLLFLSEIGVQKRTITNPLEPNYLIGQKLGCLTLDHDVDKIVFLDSDMLCLKPFYHRQRFEQFDVNAKLEDWHHHKTEHWQILYSALGLASPANQYRSTVFGEPMPLYFNSGWLAVSGRVSQLLANDWISLANHVDKEVNIPRLRPNLDQLTLPISVTKLGLSVDFLDESFNYPAELRSLNHAALPYFCHYHNPHMLLCDQLLSKKVVSLVDVFPYINTLIQRQGKSVWNAILKSL